MKTSLKTSLAVLTSFVFFGANAADLPKRVMPEPSHPSVEVSKHCPVINWRPGDVVSLQVQLFSQVHITMPEDVFDVVWFPKDMWDGDHAKNHVFISAKNTSTIGMSTGFTIVGNSQNSYEFEVTRVAKANTTCVVLNLNGSLIDKRKWNQNEALMQSQIQALSQQINQLQSAKQEVESDMPRREREAVKAYRSAITSNYLWEQGQGWFADTAIDSVHDDGRFTYIRLKNDNKGITSIEAEIDGEMQILEKTYDADKREFKVVGIYPKFILRAGNSQMVVTRRS